MPYPFIGMQLDRFTTKAHGALQDAQRLAQEHSHQAIDGEHLLLDERARHWRAALRDAPPIHLPSIAIHSRAIGTDLQAIAEDIRATRIYLEEIAADNPAIGIYIEAIAID